MLYVHMCTLVYISSKHFFSFLFFFQSKSANVLAVLGAVASEALDLTGFYYSGKPSVVKRRLNQISRTSTGRYAIFISASILVFANVIGVIIDLDHITF